MHVPTIICILHGTLMQFHVPSLALVVAAVSRSCPLCHDYHLRSIYMLQADDPFIVWL